MELESTRANCPCSCAWPWQHIFPWGEGVLKKLGLFALSCRWRPYRVESTRSLPTSEVKQPRAWLVLWWGTAWEDQGAASFCPHFFPLPQGQILPPWPVLRLQDINIECTKNLIHFPICACHPCAGAMLSSLYRSNFIGCSPKGIHADWLKMKSQPSRHSAVISQKRGSTSQSFLVPPFQKACPRL